MLCLQAHAETRAQTKPDARQERLDGFSKDDLQRIGPELGHGVVALVEFADQNADRLPAIDIALPVQANAELLTKIASDPASYPRYMPALDSVKVVAKHDNSIVYDWAFDLAVLQMRGRNVMTSYPATRPDAGSRITIDSEEGDLGRGRFLFRIYPRGDSSLLVVSVRLDLREANFVARQVAKAARSVNRSANIALAFSMAMHLGSEAERQAGHVRAPSAAHELKKPTVDIPRLAPLLNRGDLLLLEANGAQLDQVTVIGAIGQNASKVSSVMRDAKAFGSSLVPGSKAEVVSQVGPITTFDWNIALPLIGVSGRMKLTDRAPMMSIDATDGALVGGRWLFDVTPVAPEATLVTGWARFAFNDST
ncbi:MAG TPA: hypothetical protein VHZ95_18095, partial [Polyangiales bacterium]|nr:hypothetical protein [Polyangiales bacterium]